MNVRKVKRLLLMGLLSVIPLMVTVSANAEKVYETEDSKIDRVDNTKGIVVIDDKVFKLRLNTKVYGSKKRKLNRYALKVGQSVFFEAEIENKIMYLNYIVIDS